MTTKLTEYTDETLRRIASALNISPELLTEDVPVAPSNGIESIMRKMREMDAYRNAWATGLQNIFNHWLIEAMQSGAIPVNFKTLDINHTLKPEYVSLEDVLARAYMQAAVGKGAERHNLSGTTRFEDQRMQTVSLLIDSHKGMEYQVIKKITEGVNLPTHAAQIKELLGAINYIAGMILFLERKNYQKHAHLEEDESVNTSATPAAAPTGPSQTDYATVSRFKDIYGRDVARKLIILAGAKRLADLPISQVQSLADICEDLIGIKNMVEAKVVPEPISADGVPPTFAEFLYTTNRFAVAHGHKAMCALLACVGASHVDFVPPESYQALMTLAGTFTSNDDIAED